MEQFDGAELYVLKNGGDFKAEQLYWLQGGCR